MVWPAHWTLVQWGRGLLRDVVVSSGGLLPLKGLDVTPVPSEAVATTREESLRIDGYRRPDWRMRFTPERVAIESKNAEIVEERTNPRASFVGHTLTTAWDIMQVAYFTSARLSAFHPAMFVAHS